MSKITRIISTILLVSLVSIISEVQTSALHSPLRVRFNSDLLRGVFHKKDQDILDIFANITLGEYDLKNGHIVKNVVVSLIPQNENKEEFNYHLSLDENKFLGLDTQDLKFKGIGEIVHGEGESVSKEQFEIEGPVTDFKFSFEVGDNDTSKSVIFKSFDFKANPEQFQIKPLGDSKMFEEHGHLEQIKTWVNDELVRVVTQIKDDTMGGSLSYLQKLPILNIAPLVALYHTTNAAEKVVFSDDFIEYDFSPLSLKMVKKTKTELLKPIVTSFAPLKDGKDPSAMQMIIDENFINTGFQHLISTEKKFSLREFMSKDPRFALFRQLLTTSTIGMALPAFKEEYGEGKAVDIISTISHTDIQELLENVVPSGFTLDQKGNFKVFMNVGSQIIIEKTPGQWEDSRKLVMTFGMKGKLFIADEAFDNKTLVVYPRGLELSTLKIFKGDDEQFLEQMLAQSLIGVQLDQLKKGFKPNHIPLKDFHNPAELQCFGFNLSNLDVFINKGFLQINGNYIKVDKPYNEQFCKNFENTLKESPEKLTEILSSYIPGFPGLDQFKRPPSLGDMANSMKEPIRRPSRQEQRAKKREQKRREKENEDDDIPDNIAEELKEDL